MDATVRRFDRLRSRLLKVFFNLQLYTLIIFFFGWGGKRVAMNIYNKSLLPEDTLSLAA